MGSLQAVRRAALVGLLALLALLEGCATGMQANPRDPFEPFNRKVSAFNDSLDAAVLKPVATVYRDVLPSPVRTGVSNFFGNLTDVWSGVNSLLQLKLINAAENFMRFGVNTVFGLYGVLDVASEVGLERHREDFGQTLGRWGVPAGPYLVLPLLGPSTLRDSVALPTDLAADPVRQVDPASDRWAAYSLRLVDTRAGLLRLGSMLDEVALDKYSFTRDAYLQRRRAEVFDGALEVPSDDNPAPPDAPGDAPASQAPAPSPAASATPGPGTPAAPAAR